MTHLLEQALEQVKQLPEAEQDTLAALVLQEIRSEQRWQEAFAGSQDQLARLGQEALAEFRAGKTRKLDPDAL